MEKKNRKHGNQDNKLAIIVIMILFLYTIIRVLVVRLITMQGSAYFFSSYELITVLLILFPISLSEVLTQQVRKRVEIEQFRNAKHLYNSAMFMTVIYSIIVTIVLLCCSNMIAEGVLIGKGSILSLIILIPIILFSSIALVIRGYLNGIYNPVVSIFTLVIKMIVMLLGVILFSGLLSNYGEAVSAVLLNTENQYAFGAAGSAIGILTGSAAGMILCILLLAGSKREIRKQIRRDPTKRKEDITGLFRLLISITFPVSFGILLLNSYQIVDQWFYTELLHNSTDEILISYQWGAYAGIFKSVVFLPLIMVYALCYKEKASLLLGMENGDQHEVRIKAQGMLKDSIIITFLFAVFSGVLARPIASGIFATDSDLVVALIRIGCIGIIFMGYAVASVIVLAGTGNHMSNIINGVIALTLHIIVLFYTGKILHLGIYSVLIAFMVFGAIYSVMNCLSLMRIIHYRFDLKKILVLPFISAVVAGIVALLLQLVFQLFLSPLLCVLLIFPFAFLAYFIALCVLGAITSYSVSSFPLGNWLLKLGKLLKIFR